MAASIFKPIPPTDKSITPFPAYYKFSYTYESGSVNNSPDIQVLYGEKYIGSGIRNVNRKYELFDSVSQSFYSPLAYTSYGISENSYIPSESVYIVSIPQRIFGEKVLPGSFTIQVGTSQSYDDGQGNLIVSSSGTGSIIGRMFYDKGIALFKPTSSISGGGLTNNGLYIINGTVVDINFSSSVTFYENTYKIRLAPVDFLFSVHNPTSTNYLSGSTITPVQLMVSQSLLPYITTIGLYNSNNELIMVAKPSVPVQRTKDVTQTFIIKYDI
jgi:hypothetical protein